MRETAGPPFADLAGPAAPCGALRERIRAEGRRPEPDCLLPLLAEAAPTPAEEALAGPLAERLVRALRAKGQHGPVESLMREYDLSTREGVALMCLAEALLRIPDAATRDALIRDKIGGGDWRAHLAHPASLFAGAATWGLVVAGEILGADEADGLGAVLTRLLRRGGEPLVRAGLDRAMRVLGGQFVTGRTIAEALEHARAFETRGFTYSYDMLGEAAMSAADAARYAAAYAEAIAAIGAASAGRGPYAGPGISIKLSALHPRYARAQRERVLAELLPQVADLAASARAHEIGLNIDAEEADRLDLSLDILAALAADPRLSGWDGLGFVVQAYGKRAPAVIAFAIDLARRTRRRLMLRLVKGAYWDAEIKRAQVEGVPEFPVFTRKLHTDVAYLACARKLLAARDAVFPQFATHNARTLAAVLAMAGPDFRPGDYEFQCLHGMGEALYGEVVGAGKLDRPCRMYAPVGSHETLLAYLVRRLLENGANASFVHRIGDPAVPVAELASDPVAEARAVVPPGAPHPGIRLPGALFPDRANAAGFDLADEDVLAGLARGLAGASRAPAEARPLLGDGPGTGEARPILNPADSADIVGRVVEADAATVEAALVQAETAAPAWAATTPEARAAILERAADRMEAEPHALLALLIREAGKTLPNAIAELREAVDFLRYYAAQVRRDFSNATHRPLGPIACISPWNFPLAIFTGQVAAALAAGNPVLAKPAEETPLIAARAVAILREAGVPPAALQFLPGDGAVGAWLVADSRVCGVMFTGSTEIAKRIQTVLAGRLGPDGRPVPLVAETGGQNAMVVDSSALPEQVVADVLASAFDSAGQRCSALRVLCLQAEIADRVLAMLKGAVAELRVGDPVRLATDVGPVISEAARAGILDHVAGMRARGRTVHAPALPPDRAAGHFVAPTLVEIDDLAELEREVFGPVLHVLRFHAEDLGSLLAGIAATGYGLTFGVHSRIDAAVRRMVEAAPAGNLYVNRNMIGAVVGVQPFGGGGLSGTGPKAGGPLYLRRLLAACPAETGLAAGAPVPASLRALRDALRGEGRAAEASLCERVAARAPLGHAAVLPGPVGEENRYDLLPRGTILCLPLTETGLFAQLAAALATGNQVRLCAGGALRARVADLPESVRAVVGLSDAPDPAGCAAILAEAEGAALEAILRAVAEGAPAVIPVHTAVNGFYPPEWLVRERSLSTNTAAAGGNASLMAVG
ncbi:bifunctional proline dehydrogenase/L-glutamate gamma-semialdehyde dehydrogenase PutA [Methylobacterium radiodurans]|uniref:Bifunctional protein PutA n=1 Tax=Methylobacterium radiodurans TaxID=2202828 RepID=A0A2U8VLU5_9HYPH|nr:bifunctional proline dehydrogenase/L-glutamate gamma-semialdehyde dehydrogenase PutA [Methylobacterium radiodurans]AWN34448.1 trifunctional transcriptional regulator/proline dehydrogenase/L-glutamate gamma-semialdehyde dehydrogenase [Methylobacterium radiodurans]